MSEPWCEGFQKVIGKRIQGLMVFKGPSHERSQVFIVFDDGTHYELYGEKIRGCKDIDRGGMDKIRLGRWVVNGAEVLLDAEAK